MGQPSGEVTVEVEVEPPATDTSDSVEAVTVAAAIDHAAEIAALRSRIDVLEAANVATAEVAETAQISADIAQETASAAFSEAIDANQETAALAEAVEVIAEGTDSTADDAVVEEVVVPETAVEDAPARKGNFWFDDDLKGRFRR